MGRNRISMEEFLTPEPQSFMRLRITQGLRRKLWRENSMDNPTQRAEQNEPTAAKYRGHEYIGGLRAAHALVRAHHMRMVWELKFTRRFLFWPSMRQQQLDHTSDILFDLSCEILDLAIEAVGDRDHPSTGKTVA